MFKYNVEDEILSIQAQDQIEKAWVEVESFIYPNGETLVFKDFKLENLELENKED